MSPSSVSRFWCLLFITLSFLVSPCAAENGDETQAPTNQSGTIHLPVAVSRWVDQTHMGIAAVNTAGQVHAKRAFISSMGRLLRTYLSASTPFDKDRASAEIRGLVKTAYYDAARHRRDRNSSYHDIYLGGEASAGTGKPVYGFPSVTYGNARRGFDVGADVLFQGGDTVTPYRRSLGLSAKYELTNQARDLVSLLDKINYDLILLDSNNVNGSSDANDLNLLYHFFVLQDFHPLDNTPLTNIENIYLPLGNDGPGSTGMSDPDTRILTTELDRTNRDLMQLIQDYIHKTESPAVSAVVEDRFVQHDGTLLDYGLTASTLVPFRQGGVPAGVTFLGAVQQFEDRLHDDPHRSATRTGIAAIWQDRTPSYDAASSTLAATWNVKAGLEYTSPILNMHETYAEFVRYRDVHTYAEITLTVGKDGLRKDYADVSVGKSFVF